MTSPLRSRSPRANSRGLFSFVTWRDRYIAAVQRREFDLQTARNDALMYVALAYFDVQQARGTLAGTRDVMAKGEAMANKIAGLAKGLTPSS